MYVEYSCEQIGIAALEPLSDWDIHPYLGEDQPILQDASSIKRFGLIHPPLVLETSKARYKVIIGKRAIARLRRYHDIDSISCRVLPPTTTPGVILGLIYEAYSTTQRELSAIQAAHFHALCRVKLQATSLEEFYLDYGLPAKPHQIRRSLDLLKLEPSLQLALYMGTLAENSAREMISLKSADRIACFELFRKLQLGGGKQRRMYSLLRDLAGRQGCSLSTFLSSDVIQDILNHQEMNTPQKAHSMLQKLQQLHSPSLAEAEDRFARWRAQLPLAKGCKVEHAVSFEQDTVTLRIEFKDKDELEKVLPALNSILPR